MVRFSLFFMIIITVFGCSSDEVEQLSPKVLYDRAVKLYQEEDYYKASKEFSNLSYIAAGTEYEDQAKFYLGMSYYQMESYVLAADAFDQLIKTNAGSSLVPDASYYKALSYYKLSPRASLDQTNAIEAISDFQTFIDYFPAHAKVKDAIEKIAELREKLAKKEYENGVLYMKMEYFKSATNYFQYVMDKYYDTQYAEQANIGKIESLLMRKRYSEMDTEIEKFNEKYLHTRFAKELEELEKKRDEERSKSESKG